MPSFPEVIFEDNHLLIVNKRPGDLVQGDETGDIPLVELCKQYIGKKYNKPGDVFLGVVHRLDRPVSGVVVFARTSKALERMNALFRQRETKKTYWAIVDAKPKRGDDNLVHWLAKDEKKNKTTAWRNETQGALRSELHYHVIASVNNLYLLEVNPITGRSHQIRVQLAAIGCPIVGDLKYGAPVASGDNSILLHSRQLEFVHPVRQNVVQCTATPPPHPLWNAFAHIEK